MNYYTLLLLAAIAIGALFSLWAVKSVIDNTSTVTSFYSNVLSQIHFLIRQVSSLHSQIENLHANPRLLQNDLTNEDLWENIMLEIGRLNIKLDKISDYQLVILNAVNNLRFPQNPFKNK
jgi:hypothetical protein